MNILPNLYYLKRGTKSGQALYEFLLTLWVLPLFVAIIISLTRIGVTRLTCLQAARHGAFLMATEKISKANMVKEVKQFMADSGFDKGKVKVESEDDYHLSGTFPPYPASKVTVTYKVKVFGNLDFWGGNTTLDHECKETVVCGKMYRALPEFNF